MYKLSVKATEDFAGIYEYTFLNFGSSQADFYTGEMESCLQNLSGQPLIGRELSDIGLGIHRYDYLKHAIFYQIRDKDIFIVRILHQQMNPTLHL